MTVQELIDVMPYCDLLEVVVRKEGHGQWIQGYRIGKNVKIYPSEYTIEEIESRSFRNYDRRTVDVKEGDIVDIRHAYGLPMKVIAKDCHKLPDYVGLLEVCTALPRHVPQFHGEALTHNDFSLEVNCYSDDFVPERVIESKDVTVKQIDGQMDITDFLGGTT